LDIISNKRKKLEKKEKVKITFNVGCAGYIYYTSPYFAEVYLMIKMNIKYVTIILDLVSIFARYSIKISLMVETNNNIIILSSSVQ